jgi:hypothetical protein
MNSSWEESPVVGNNRSFIYHSRNCPNVMKMKEDRRVGFRSVSHAQWWRYKKSTGCPEICQ